MRHGVMLALLCALAAAAPATAAKRCAEPAGGGWAGWERAQPREAGFDPAKLQAAVDAAMERRSYAVRVYRRGCLVAEDRRVTSNREARFESWSMAKSITSMVFGRAMSMGLISPDDPLGAFVPEAGHAHGALTMRDLLTMTSGLYWNGMRDYDIFMPDRINDALTTEIVRRPGTFYEYSQSGPALLAFAIGRAVGRDFQDFAQDELFGPLGIERSAWVWQRDAKGNTQGFYGVGMRPDDYGRLGELMLRDGVWKGRRLLNRDYLREAIRPTATNPGYGWMFWVNRGDWYIGPRGQTRPVYPHRLVPGAPVDMYQFSGLFDQRVVVFPSQEMVFVRTGTSAGEGVNLASGGAWEQEVYGLLLAAITDQRVELPPDGGEAPRESTDPDRGFHTALFEPDQYVAPWTARPLPPAGPPRARAVRLRLFPTVSKRRARGRVTCPVNATAPCVGQAELRLPGLERTRRRTFELAPGRGVVLRFGVPATARRALRRTRAATLLATTVAAGGPTATQSTVALRVAGRR